MAAPVVALLAFCAACVVGSGLVVFRLRPRMSKHRRAALTFVVPGALLALPAFWTVVNGALIALSVLVTMAALCFAAATLFMPTAATRFASFERQFWAHVRRQA